MDRRTIALQDMRGCRWSQPQFLADADADEVPLNAPWECVRIPGQERPVSEEECVTCEHWEPDDMLVIVRRRN